MACGIRTVCSLRGYSRGICAGAAGLLLAVAHAAAGPEARSLDANVDQITTTQVQWRGVGRSITRVIAQNAPADVRSSGVVDRGIDCLPVTESVAAGFSSLDTGSEITMQLGMRQNEGFGVVYTVGPALFPIEIKLIEAIFATIADGSGNISCGYKVDIYDGDPTAGTGELVYSLISDPDPSSTGLPGDVVLQRRATCTPTNGTSANVGKLQLSVDNTADTQDRWIISNVSGTGKFTVVIVIDRMNDANPAPCALVGGEEPACNNIFMCTEGSAGGLNFASRDLLSAIDCGASGLFAPPGLTRFNQLGVFSPSRDVLQQVTYTSLVCAPLPTGACCNVTTGSCSVLDVTQCAGTYLGDNTLCSPNPCDQPVGACCRPDGACSVIAADACVGTGFVFRGGGSVCASANCPQPVGACCNGNACAAGVASGTCATLGGSFMGGGSTCGPSNSCPIGACCLADGSCFAGTSQQLCTQQGGTFQGLGSLCQNVACPQPVGACCTSAGSCVEINEATCTLFSGTWNGALSTCAQVECAAGGVCCKGTTCATSTQGQCTGNFTLFVGSAGVCGAGSTSPCCKADFNKASGITVQDIFDYLNAWFSADPIADVIGNGAGAPGIDSLFEFLNLWFAQGC